MSIDIAWQEAIKERFQSNPTKEEKQKFFGNALIKKWKIEFEKRCWDSPQFAEASFHVLFGQLPAVRNTRIQYEKNFSDTRIHMILFQRSGTGKGRGFNFAVGMAEELDMICKSPDDTSDAKLLGRFRFVQGEQEPVEVKGYLDPTRLPRISIFIQNEATLIIDARKTDFSKSFMNFYQKAMNPVGTPDNLIEAGTIEMLGYEVRVNPDLSFYLTTYPPDLLLETITKAGFIQRMFTLYNTISYTRREASWEEMAKKTGLISDEGEYLQDIIEAMSFINDFYTKNPQISMSEETNKDCINVMREIYKPLRAVNELIREELGDFVPRVYENTIKMAYHHAMCRLSQTVDNIDVSYALSIINPAWSRMIRYMEESDEIVYKEMRKWSNFRTDSYKVYDIIIKEQSVRGKDTKGWVNKETMIKLLSSKLYGWDKSKQTTRARFNKLVRDFKFFSEQTNKKGTKVVKKRTI